MVRLGSGTGPGVRCCAVVLHLAQVHRQVVGEPAVAGPESLGPGGLGIPHYAEPVVVGVER